MKLLIVGMPFSIHVVRWISLIDQQQCEVHFFSSFPYAKPHKELAGVIYHDYYDNYSGDVHQSLQYRRFSGKKFFSKNLLLNKWVAKGSRFLGLRKDHAYYLGKTIASVQPDVIHSMESQKAGYLVSEVLADPAFKGKKPFCVHTTFGIDLDYFRHFPEHQSKLRKLFSIVDLYLAEGKRDIELSKKLGYNGRVMKFASAGGGYHINDFQSKKAKPPSQRKLVLIKGYQDTVRRGLVALHALVLCKDVLEKYEVIAYSCAPQVKEYISYINSQENMNIKIYKETGYDDWLTTLSQARISVTNNLSDGIPSSLFESMLLGVFPIQSNTSCADEWIENGRTGFLTSPEDPAGISVAIRKALTDDAMVDAAAPINFQKVASELSHDQAKQRIQEMYSSLSNINEQERVTATFYKTSA
jgi:glycosyltransferase involved in cell wall biosynthesis